MIDFLKERGVLSFTRLITAISIVSFLIVSFYLAYTNTDWRGYDTFSNLTGGGGIGAQLVNKFISERTIPHLLLNGHRGTGKTSLAVVLKNELEIDDSDFMVINASDENNVDTMRNKIKGFISTYSMSEFKLVLLDEADYLSQSAQALLRNMMEEYANNARFILSCNRGNKIIPELKSRCFEILFKRMDKTDMMERLAIILKTEKVKVNLRTLTTYVDLAYPDMRKAIQLIQNNSVDGMLQEPSEIDPSTEVNLKVVELMEANKYSSIRLHPY